MQLSKTLTAFLCAAALVGLSLYWVSPTIAHEGHEAAAHTAAEHVSDVPGWYHTVHYGVIIGAMVIAGTISLVRHLGTRKNSPKAQIKT